MNEYSLAKVQLKYINNDKKVVIDNEHYVNIVLLSKSRRYLLTVCDKRVVKIWDYKSLLCLFSTTKYDFDIWHVSWSHDEKNIAIVSLNNSFVHILNIESKKETVIGDEGCGVTSASFHPNGNEIVVSYLNHVAKIWDIKNNKEIMQLHGHSDAVVWAEYNKNGKYIITTSADKTIRTWNGNDGTLINKMTGHTSDVWSACFDTKSKYVISASIDKRVCIWDFKSGICIDEFVFDDGQLFATFNSKSNKIMALSDKGIIRVWDFNSLQQIINETSERFKNRKLNTQERQKYYL